MELVTLERETSNSLYLVEQLKTSEWVDNSTILVNVCPNYSSRLTQVINHKLSAVNNGELFEVLNLEFPSFGSQVWDAEQLTYTLFDKYLYTWVHKYLDKNFKYLFIVNTVLSGKSLLKLRHFLKTRFPLLEYRIVAMYALETSVVQPDFCVRKFQDIPPKFFWEA